MKTYNLKSVIRRGSMLVAAFVVAGAAILPATSASADALNPLTDRSLTLSSGSPGWAYTDGSGNTTYAPPNSGANGKKTGNTFAFKVSTDSSASGTNEPIKAMTFQYCTTSAGDCQGPGDITPSGTPGTYTRASNADSEANQESDLEIVSATPSQATFGSYVNASTGAVTSIPAPSSTGSNFLVYYRTSDNGTPGDDTDDTWAASTGWTMTTQNRQDGTVADGTATGKDNQIDLVNATGLGIAAGTPVKVVFFATDANYITNPGSGAFFVKINTYKDYNDLGAEVVVDEANLIDGGVTVANVMNQSIQITTKVLETMDFSVGTVDPYTLTATGAAGSQLETAYPGHNVHGPCDPILKGMNPTDPVNTLQLGNAVGEFSLETDDTYSTHSYWRLSSNSSAGATVYYSGVTLSNTVGDKIDAIGGTAAAPIVGSEQFGLALDNGSSGNYQVSYNVERTAPNLFQSGADNATSDDGTPGIDSSVTDAGISNLTANASWHQPQLAPLLPTANYGGGTGFVNSEYGTINTQFAFDENSNQIPVAMATQDTQVVDCVTGKVRYIANIAATTPAGIYTTKINYIAAPQY